MDTLQKYLGSWISMLRVIGCLNDGTDSDCTNYLMAHDPMLTQIHTIRSRFLCWYMFSVLLSYCSFCHFYCSLTLSSVVKCGCGRATSKTHRWTFWLSYLKLSLNRQVTLLCQAFFSVAAVSVDEMIFFIYIKRILFRYIFPRQLGWGKLSMSLSLSTVFPYPSFLLTFSTDLNNFFFYFIDAQLG